MSKKPDKPNGEGPPIIPDDEIIVAQSRPVDPDDIPSLTAVPELAAETGKEAKVASTYNSLRSPDKHPVIREYNKIKKVLESNGFRLEKPEEETRELEEGPVCQTTFTALERKKGFRRSRVRVAIESLFTSHNSEDYTPINNELHIRTDPNDHDSDMEIFWRLYNAGINIGQRTSYSDDGESINSYSINSEIDSITRTIAEIVKILESYGLKARNRGGRNWHFDKIEKGEKTSDYMHISIVSSERFYIHNKEVNPTEKHKIWKKIKAHLEKRGLSYYINDTLLVVTL